jgi:hypothetical protein
MISESFQSSRAVHSRSGGLRHAPDSSDPTLVVGDSMLMDERRFVTLGFVSRGRTTRGA